ncbi:hypothetical protein CH333_09505 [candidate division WOR-3 bacterium JGI_Cruoil_03_44_89]|uniref:Thioredoxin domain-containing protein n=1 Tax=candidate division WOR-3 bacterium JGI_Cruoil_03_44_89 TaxID=1973748 RepID=A0A235BP22_UNCW3|nr:MAG: hypothetical protein CH333_09505 [candidate division WOR-3 bacterium JGI_Cruoil_03_44_89]
MYCLSGNRVVNSSICVLLGFIFFLGTYTPLFSEDELIITPDQPQWGDTLYIELHPAEERGELFINYSYRYPFWEQKRGWIHFSGQNGIYKSPSIVIDSGSIEIFIEVKGKHYSKTICSLLPYEFIKVYASNGKPADEVLGDTTGAIILKWRNILFEEKDSGQVKTYINELENKSPQTLLDCYLVAKGYSLLGENENALKFIGKMYEMDSTSPLILVMARRTRAEPPEIKEEIENYIIGFIDQNPEKLISWETTSFPWEFENIPDTIAEKVLKTWHTYEPQNPTPLYYLAVLLRNSQKLDEALNLINEAIALEKQGFLIIYEHRGHVPEYRLKFHKLRGEIHEETGNVELAIKNYEKALSAAEYTNETVPVYTTLGKIFFEREQQDKSEQFCFKAFIGGDTTESESMLKKIYEEKYANNISFKQYLHLLYDKIKSDYRKAPDFELTDIDSETVRLSENEGKLIAINFWSRSCKACMNEIPYLNQIYDDFKDENVIFWAIGSSNEEFLESHPFKFRIVPLNREIWQKYNILGVPQCFIIDPHGLIIYHAFGGGKLICDAIRRVLTRLILTL